MAKYEGVIAYAFIGGLTRESMEELFELARSGDTKVHSAVRLIGSAGAMVCIHAGSLDEVDDILWQIQDDDPCCLQVGIAMMARLPLVTWSGPPPVGVFVRARVEPGRAEEVLEATAEVRGVLGAVIVSGGYDLLIEIGGESIDEITESVMRELHAIRGIVSTDSAFATKIVTDGSEHPREV